MQRPTTSPIARDIGSIGTDMRNRHLDRLKSGLIAMGGFILLAVVWHHPAFGEVTFSPLRLALALALLCIAVGIALPNGQSRNAPDKLTEAAGQETLDAYLVDRLLWQAQVIEAERLSSGIELGYGLADICSRRAVDRTPSARVAIQPQAKLKDHAAASLSAFMKRQDPDQRAEASAPTRNTWHDER